MEILYKSTVADDLADVTLEGKSLIGDDPRAWCVCRSLGDTTDLLGWWETLIASDDATYEQWDSLRLGKLRLLRDRFDILWNEFQHSIVQRREIYHLYREILALGLNSSQAAVLCNVTQRQVVESLIVTRAATPAEVSRRIEAEALLRLGISQGEVSSMSGLTIDEVQQWAGTVGVKSPHRNAYGVSFPPSIKERAMELYDSGLKGSAVVAVMLEENPEGIGKLNAKVVGQWATRSGRSKKRAA